MKNFIALLFVSLSLYATAQQSATLTPGTVAPDIKLKNVNGKLVSFNDYPAAKGFIVVFTCNTCPYSKKYEQRLIALDAKYTPMGFPVIAINPNDPSASNGDSYDEMKSYAKSKSFTFPYLYDEGQVITAAYGAKATPHIFLLSKSAKGQVIEYTGAVDSDTPGEDPNRTKYVEDAVDALLAQKKPALAITKAIGCRVKWKSM